MRGCRKFCQESKFDKVFFLVVEGIENPNITINGPSSAHQRHARLMAFHWCAMVAQH